MNELQNIIVPKENVNDEFVIINSVLFKDRDKVSKGDIVATIETSKTDFSIEADIAGYIVYFCKEGEEVHVGNPIAKIFDSINATEIASLSTDLNQKVEEIKHGFSGQEIDPEFTKAAMELVKSHNIPKEVFQNKTFVSKDDVLAYLESSKKIQSAEKSDLMPDSISTSTSIEKLSSSKKREISYLANGQNAGLTCTFSINIDNEGILNHARKNHVIFKLTIIPSLVYEVSRLLEEFAVLNSYFENNQILKYKDINIGYAIDINYGLKVITLYKTNTLSVNEIENQLNQKFEKYSNQTLELSDLTNSTFTITDLSKTGVHYFQPLINKNQSAILGISSVDFKTNSFNVSLTFDHRVTEGKVASAFLNSLKKNIEKYYKQSESYINPKENIIVLTRKIEAQIKSETYDLKEQAFIIKEILKTLF
jgi:pyruvate dehydrogenase E2 component (dihydrolipoamide acetyltransferase)